MNFIVSSDSASWIFMIAVIVIAVILFYRSIEQDINCISKNKVGRNHCGIVTGFSSGGDIHFDEMSQVELVKQLESDFRVHSVMEGPCINALDNSHLAEYRIFTTRRGRVKTIGYITKNRVVFEGRSYYFSKEA